ncbi:MAG: NUDIX hydrolase, partial [Methylomonas sp.]
MSEPQIHPRLNDQGKPVKINHPSTATPLDCFDDPNKVVIVVPDGETPESLSGISMSPWTDAPACTVEWQHVAGQAKIEEPVMHPKPGKKLSAGCVIVE